MIQLLLEAKGYVRGSKIVFLFTSGVIDTS